MSTVDSGVVECDNEVPRMLWEGDVSERDDCTS